MKKTILLIGLSVLSVASVYADSLVDAMTTTVNTGSGVYLYAADNGVDKKMLPSTLIAAPLTNAAETTLTFASTLTTDLTTPVGVSTNSARSFIVTLTGNFTLANPINVPNSGQVVTWTFIQDGTGSRTITLDTQFAFGTDITGIVLTTTAGKRDFMTARWNATASKWYVVGFSRGY